MIAEAPPFTGPDREKMRSEGRSEEKAMGQLEIFRRGQIFTRLDRAATLNDGILRLSQAERESLAGTYQEAAAGGRVMQFVPASGAATRLFKSLMAVWMRSETPALAQLTKEAGQGQGDAKEFLEWFQGLPAFAFAGELRRVLERDGLDMDALLTGNSLITAKEYRPLLEYLLTSKGLGYAEMPKALIPFHKYKHPDALGNGERARTPLEEHLSEAVALVRDAAGICRIHFTVSPQHESQIMAVLERVRGGYESAGTRFEIGLSVQKPSTDTLAVDPENRPLRDSDNALVFRPGGHGALLENLFRTGGDIVFLRNVDNVLPEPYRAEAVEYRKALAGYLVRLQERIFAYIRRLGGKPDSALTEEVAHFVEQRLGTYLSESLRAPAQDARAADEKRALLLKILDRPLRVCAMVKNQGEPGGGPFWVRHKDGSVRLQIVESSQIDMGTSQQRKIAESATHFNPTDLVCGLRNHAGSLFKLQDFVDPETCFVSTKSIDGRPVKALELPGLWNGSMAHWNTVFVEAPVETFNPVKTVTDLLRPGHQ